MATPGTIEGVLFEIARTLDFCRNDPAFPGSAAQKQDATGHIRARRKGGRIEMDLIEWKGGPLERLAAQTDDEATLLAIHRHVTGHADAFESHG